MDITLLRQKRPAAQDWTLGHLFIAGTRLCYTCEDVVRPPGATKVPGNTAIPAGRYRVVITRSNRFSELAGHDVFLPLLMEVPGFTGIRIHTGNTPADTEGCILPGLSCSATGVQQSAKAFTALFDRIRAALVDGEVWIDIMDAPSP